MAHSKDIRKRVLEYLAEGHTHKEAQKTFKVGETAIKEWKKLLAKTGSLDKRTLNRKATRFPSAELHAYMKEHPQAMLKEIAEHFNGSTSGAYAALAREKITLKKGQPSTASGTRKSKRVSTQN